MFEKKYFAAYGCYYCGFWNPARKQKPFAPKLDFDTNSPTTVSNISQVTQPSNIDEEEPAKLPESETCRQSDLGIFFLLSYLYSNGYL